MEAVKVIGNKTPLNANHIRRGARMVDFSGWEMPLQYDRVVREHQAVRTAAGLFDISHMGLVCVRSGDPENTRRFLDGLVPQDLSKLYPGKAVYTQFLNENGGIIDDIIVYQLPAISGSESDHFPEFQEFLVICNASNVNTDIDWMRRHAHPGIRTEFLSSQYALLALQGPRFAEVLEKAGIQKELLPKRFHIQQAEAVFDQAGKIPVYLARTGYTGEDGVEIIVKASQVEALWDNLLSVGEGIGAVPVGLAARDTLRLEAAYPLHGHDIGEAYTPLEAGLGWSVKLEKPGDFIGKAALLRQKNEGLARSFYCFKLKKNTIPRQHDVILYQGQPVGEVTSGSISPTLNLPIGMGYIQSGVVSGPGTAIQVRIRNQDVDAEIVQRPFYQQEVKKG